ncbi:MAG: hypothetical protein SFZ24_02445 [Planctomycetota bacterium]|nr:hypothetical protein [Planctomycetota bacterium]
MIFNALVALLVVVVAVIWSTKGKGFGLFSAFLACVCVVIAGGIAFAAWEPLAYFLLRTGGSQQGFVGNLLQSTAWSVGLLGPFLVSLLVLRLAMDSLVGANMDFSETANSIGGIAFGAVSGIISVGILVVGTSFLPLPASLMGYAPIEERNGSPVYARSLWIPVDAWTIKLYEHLSRHAFASSTPLARYQPNAHQAAALSRVTYKDASRNTILPTEFEVVGSYTVKGPLDQMLTDTFLVDDAGNTKKQQVTFPDGTQPTGGATLVGYAIRLESGAKEKQGNVIFTPAQLRLLCRNEDGASTFVSPIAVIAPPEAAAESLYRFRFDAKESFIASQGGGAEAVFAFEFIVPEGYTPAALFVKNTRADLTSGSSLASASYDTFRLRDRAIQSGAILSKFGASARGSSLTDIDRSASKTVATESNRAEGFEFGASLPGNKVMNKSNRGSIEVSDKGEIVGGEHTFPTSVLNERGLDKNLRVERFQTTPDTGIIKLKLSDADERTMFGRAFETAEGEGLPVLVDDKGAVFEPVGFLYDDGNTVQLRYSPGRALRSLSEIPQLSRSKRNQTLYVIYRPTVNSKISAFIIGNKQIATFEPPLNVTPN